MTDKICQPYIPRSGRYLHLFWYICSALLLLSLSWPINGTKAQELQCDPNLKPIPGSYGYKKFPNRCEGLYELPTSTHRILDVVSLLKGRLRYSLKTNATLEVRVASAIQTGVHVRAVGINTDSHYRLDSNLKPRDVLRWPLGDIVQPNGFDDTRIGLFGWAGSEQDKVFVPLRVTAPGSSAPGQERIILKVQPTADLEKMLWQFSFSCQDCDVCANYGPEFSAKDIVDKYETKDIELPNSQGKPICVFLQMLQRENGTWSHMSIKVQP